MASTSLPLDERKRTAKELALREAEDRHRHELLDPEERLLLEEQIRRLKKTLAS